MTPMLPPPYLIVDTWGFRLVDPDGNYLGKDPGVIAIRDSSGNIVSLEPPRGVEHVVAALALNE